MQAAGTAGAVESRIACQARRTLEENLAELPVECDWGRKRDNKGVTHFWSGYKLHVDMGDGGLPVAALLSSASLHDSRRPSR